VKHTTSNQWTLALASIGLISIASMAVAQTTNTPPATNTPSATAPTNAPGFFTRFDHALREQLGQPAYTPPDTNAPATPSKRRAFPAPFDSPPFPTGDWQIGGTPIIGDENALPTYPLTQAIWGIPDIGPVLEKNKINMYGWEDASFNFSSSRDTALGPTANAPMAYDSRPNRVEQNQGVLFIERDPDEAQTDHPDWGFRYSVIYGLDYRYMISRGFLSGQLLKSAPGVIGQPAGNPGNFYGWDMPMMYANLYIPNVFEGLNLTLGRIISEPDIEAQLAPNNLMSSHSLLYTFDPYTQWGLFSSWKINNNWTVQAGVCAGVDVAPWETQDPGCQPTGTVMIQWISDNQKDSLYWGANAFNNGDFGYNNLQAFVGTWTHKFNDKWQTATESWYMYEHSASTAPTASVPYQSGAFPVRPGFAPEWSILNYTSYRLGPSTFVCLRNEYFDDFVGARTGFDTAYTEHALGLTWWPDKLITVRPEIRLDHAVNKPAYDNGTRYMQFSASCDVIFHF
jgi:hypothetical protein